MTTTTTTKSGLLALPLLLLLTMAGCQPRDGRAETKQRVLMHTGFEELLGWAPEVSPTLTTEKAHSGKFAVRVDSRYQYSPSFRTELGQLCSHRPRRFTLSAWVWVPSFKDDAVFVLSLANPADPDHPFYSKNVYLTTSGPFQEWKQVSRDFDLPETINSKTLLTIYLWNSSAGAPVYTDDWQLTELW